MAKEFFKDLPNTTTPLTASRLNGLLDGEEPMGQLVVDSIRSKNMFDKNSMVYSTNAYLPYDTSNTQLKYINDLAGVLVIKLNEGKTYTISKIAGGRFRGGFTNTPTPALDTNNVITSRVNNNDTGTSITFTVPTNNPYFVCNFYSADQTADVNAGYSNILNSIQVEEGTTATTYTPYQNLGGKEHYSTSEIVIGTWINGKPLYRKVVEFGAMPNATASSKQHGISNIYKIVHIGGYWEKNGSFNTLPNVNPSSQSASVNVSADPSVIWIQTGTDRTDCIATVVLEYTKTTD